MESAIVFYFLVIMKELKVLGLPTRVMALALVLPSGETIVFYLCRANYATPTESPSELYFILKLSSSLSRFISVLSLFFLTLTALLTSALMPLSVAH